MFGDALLERFPFAAFVSKTVTVEPRGGNPAPRLWETPAGLINSIGLPNKGLAGYLEHDLPQLAAAAGPADRQRDGLHARRSGNAGRRVLRRATRSPRSSSTCRVPNVETGLIMGADPSETARLVERVRPLTAKPLIVKLTPNTTDVGAVAEAAEAAGADALSLINTVRGMALHPRGDGTPWLGGGTGGSFRAGGAGDSSRAGTRGGESR